MGKGRGGVATVQHNRQALLHAVMVQEEAVYHNTPLQCTYYVMKGSIMFPNVGTYTGILTLTGTLYIVHSTKSSRCITHEYYSD